MPPPKVKGQQKVPRRINGDDAMDVATWGGEFGLTPKAQRAAIARGLVPYRKFGGRLIILRSEWQKYLAALPGVTVDQALENLKARETGR
jgi:hypothetical protein